MQVPMKVLMLIRGHLQPLPGAPEVGGAGRQCLKLSKALVQQGVGVTIVTDRLSWRDPAQKKTDGVPVIFVNTGRPFVYRKGLRRLGAYIYIASTLLYLFRHRAEYDIIHAHSARVAGFVGVLAGKWLKKKSIFKVMNSGARNDALELRKDTTIIGARRMADYLLNCDHVIVLNPAAADELGALGFRSDQIELIPNGVEVDEIKPKTCYANADTLQVIFVGRLAASKGIDVLLKAFQTMTGQMNQAQCRLVILGKGALMQPLQELACSLGIAPNVNFAGQVADVKPYLSASDIFVLPSHGEGISNALLEAMASGLPCITTDTPGNNNLIQHEQNGLLIGANDNGTALAQAMLRLAHRRDLRERLGRAARRTVEDQYSIAATARHYIRLYQDLLACPA